MNSVKKTNRFFALVLAVVMIISLMPVTAHAGADDTLAASLNEAKSYIDGITINNSSNDPATVVKNFKTHFTWDNEKRENSKSYLFDWSYYNGVVFEGIEYVYEVTGESVYKDYVVEYMSSMITSSGGWATCSNNSSKQAAGYNSTHGADCYKTASLLMDTYEMTGDSRYLTMAKTLYADLDSAANSYLLKNAGYNYRHTWASDPSPDLWLDGLYMILPFRAEYAKYIGDQEELDLIVSRMQWVSDNMYNNSKKLFYHAADSASSNSGTYWLRSIGWYAAAIVDIMDSMEGDNLEAMKAQLVKLVDGMKACQNASNGMWLNNMNASQSSSNPYETSGTALTCYAVMKAVNNGWLDESYADMAILAFNGICNEKLSGSTLTDICFKGAPGSSNSTFYDNEGKGVGPFIMLYAEILEYVNKEEEEPEVTEPEVTEPEVTEPEVTEPEVTEPEVTEPEVTEPEATEPEATEPSEPEEEPTVYSGTGYLEGDLVYTLDTDGINSGEKYLIVYSGKALRNNNGVDANPSVTVSNNTITLEDDSQLAWTITQSSGSNYYVENNGSYINLSSSGNDPIGSSKTVYITRSSSKYTFRNASGSGAYLRYSSSQLFCAGTNSSNNGMYLYRRTGSGTGDSVLLTVSADNLLLKPGQTGILNGALTVNGAATDLAKCDISWESSDTDVLTVSGGTIQAVASGEADVVMTLNAVNGTAMKEPIVLTIPVEVQGHDYVAAVTAPTCTEQGYTTYTCSICGDSYKADYTESTGHDYDASVKEATCTEKGLATYTCVNCADTYTEEIPAIGHNYECTVTDATCGADGVKTYRCANCGDTYTETIPATGNHTYSASIQEATCTEKGLITYTCLCGDSYTEVIEATGHSYHAAVTAPDCVNGGYTTNTCEACGDSYISDETAALGHSYEQVVHQPDCTNGGYTVHTCVRCDDCFVSDETEALGHSYETVVVEPDCTNGGYTTHTCEVCGDSYISDETAALGHDYASVIKNPTCTEGGYTTHTCLRCGNSYVSDQTAALGHDYSRVVTAPTCTEDGYTTNTCAVCGHVSIDAYVPALGHTYETVTVEPTCTEDGSVTYSCACGHSEQEVIPALGHDYESVVTEPTCTEGGYTTVTCGNCADSYVTDETEALGHRYETVTVDATCTEAGSVTHTCACGDTIRETIDALGHDYASVIKNPTCTEDGYTTHTCSRCADSYRSDETEALGHDYDAVVLSPTCTEAGYTTNTCRNCGDVYISDELAATGHDYESVVTEATCTEAGFTTHTCAACGDSYVDAHTPALGHSYSCTESDGMNVYTCVRCGDSYSEIVNWISLPGIYKLDTDGIDVGADHRYLIVGSGNAYALRLSNGTIGSTAVAIDGQTITLDQAEELEFYFVSNNSKEKNTYLITQDGTNGVYHMGGDMYYGKDNKGYWYIGSASNGAYQLYDYDNLNWYLNYGYVWSSDSVSRFAVSSNARSVRLYQKAESYIRLGGALNQTVTDADGATAASVIESLSIQFSENGKDVSGTAALTESMLNWDKTFDGTTAGVYKAVVTYEGVELGTITVTVTSKHAYVTEVVAPTCTEGGYTVRTCTECGVRYESDPTEALGHSYSCSESDGYYHYTCDRCGDSYSEKAVAYTQVTSLSSGNRYVFTFYSGGKYYALSHANNTASVVEVSVSNGEIVSEITDDLLWNYSGNKLSYTNGSTTYYLYSYTNSWWGGWWGNNGATLYISSSNSSTVSYSSSKLKVGSYYLRYSNGSVSLNSSATTMYAFIEA